MRQGPCDAGLGAVDARGLGGKHLPGASGRSSSLDTGSSMLGALRTLASRVVKGCVVSFSLSPGSGFLQQGGEDSSHRN